MRLGRAIIVADTLAGAAWTTARRTEPACASVRMQRGDPETGPRTPECGCRSGSGGAGQAGAATAVLGARASGLSHLLRVVEDDTAGERALRLEPWEVDAVRLPATGAVDLLLSLPSSPAVGLALGDSVRYLAEASKLALELVARGRLYPALERRGERW